MMKVLHPSGTGDREGSGPGTPYTKVSQDEEGHGDSWHHHLLDY